MAPSSTAAAGAAVLAPVTRVGGDMSAEVQREGDGYVYEQCAITTPLPEGYPPPTPPGAIDLKRYPSVRRAEIASAINPDLGMNVTFFPLFWHIKDRGIAMTSPVEMNYEGMTRGEGARPDSWTMSFLYRTPELGETGKAGMVHVTDREPLLVVSLGAQGGYGIGAVDRDLQTLFAWLDAHPEWQQAGEPRALYYNGPEKKNSEKWFEVQIPIAPATSN